MVENKTKFLGGASALLGLVSSYYNGLDVVAQVLMILVILDFTWGLLCATVSKSVTSKVAYKGLLKKMSYLVMIYLGVALDRVLGQSIFANVITIYLVVIEIISILEHMDKLDVQYPAFIRTLLDKLKGDMDKGSLSPEWRPEPTTLEKEE